MQTIYFFISFSFTYRLVVTSIPPFVGTAIENELYPYVVSIDGQMPGSLFPIKVCTGTLISKNWVFTAAYCLSEALRRIRYDLAQKSSKILEQYQHPGYRKLYTDAYLTNFYLVNDVGLLRVADSSLIKYGKLAPTYGNLEGLPINCIGFGLTVIDPNEAVKEKLQGFTPANVKAILVKCLSSDLWGPGICAAPKCSDQFNITTNYNTGGPLLHKDRIIGIASVKRSEVIDRFTPTNSYLKWVRSVTKKWIYKLTNHK